MTEYTKLIERLGERYGAPDLSTDQLLNRRDRKRQNQRITAGVVGIAVFVAAIWIVTSGGVFDRSETSVVPGGDVTGPAETAPPPAPDFTPTWVSAMGGGSCSDGAESHLSLRVDRRINVRFEIHGSPMGHEWRIELARIELFVDDDSYVFFRGTRGASDTGDLVVHQRVSDPTIEQGSNGGYSAEQGRGAFVAKAVDTQTGQRCRVEV